MKKYALHLIPAILLLGVLFLRTITLFAVGAVTLSPSSSSMNEGQSRVIGISLGSNPGSSVTFTITSSNPETVNISPGSITYLASEWAQTKNFTVTVPLNGTYGDTRNVIIMAKASSASQEYNGIAGGATVHVTDMTAEPGSSDPQDPPDPEDPVEEEEDDPVSEAETPITQTSTQTEQQEAAEAAETYRRLNETELASQDDISLKQAISSPSASLSWLKDGLVTGDVSAQHRALAYTIFLLFMTLGVGLIILYERKHWWLRQESKTLRWQYRHPQPKRKTTHTKKKRLSSSSRTSRTKPLK